MSKVDQKREEKTNEKKTECAPWKDVALDLIRFESEDYVVILDKYSDFVEIQKLEAKTATALISVLKRTFRSHGVPERLFTSKLFPFGTRKYQDFLRDYQIAKELSSLKTARMMLRSIKKIRRILEECDDGNLAMIQYNNEPRNGGPSPAELFMGRKLRIGRSTR